MLEKVMDILFEAGLFAFDVEREAVLYEEVGQGSSTMLRRTSGDLANAGHGTCITIDDVQNPMVFQSTPKMRASIDT